MPDLYHTLLKYDLGHLRIIADRWGLELKSREVESASEELCAALLDPVAIHETIDILPAEARAALEALITAGGKVEQGLFTRKFGEVREMGAGKRDREAPHLNPSSPAEILFYRGFLGKAFFDSAGGAQEFAYVPDDLVSVIDRERHAARAETFGRLAMPKEKSFEVPAADHLLDDATTFLAALRLNLELSVLPPQVQEHAPAMQSLLSSAKLLKKNIPQAAAIKKFLEDSREKSLGMLYSAWVDSESFDELRLIPGIICEGEWTNSPRATRNMILNDLDALPKDKWWSLPAFLHDLKARRPDFQRPAGDYDSWFIKRRSDGQYLRGFTHWDEVDGVVVKTIVQMLHLLGRADVGSPEENGAVASFRLTNVRVKSLEQGKLGIASNGRLTVPRLFPRAVRYQLARFCDWEAVDGRVVANAGQRRIENKPDDYRYQISARSLRRANEQGLKAGQLLALLVHHSNSKVPPPLVKALKRWDAHGTEARVENLSVLRVAKAEVIAELRKSRAGKFLGELLSPTAVVVHAGAIPKVIAALAELGLLAEAEIREKEPRTLGKS